MPLLATHGHDATQERALLAERWERLHARERYCPRYPDEAVVRFALTSCPDRSEVTPRALDLGCGAGRHALFLAEEGFETFAVDASRAGIEATVSRAAERQLDVGVVVAGVDEFELPADFFDVVLCNAVYCYLPLERITASIECVLRTLRPGGRFLCVTRSDDDWRAGYGTPTGPSRLRLSGLDDETPGAAEDGLEMTFLEEETVCELFASFSELRIDRRRVTTGGGRFADDDLARDGDALTMETSGLHVALRLDADGRIGHGHAVRSGALLAALPIASLAVAGEGEALREHFPEATLHDPDAFGSLAGDADLAIVDHPDPEHALGRGEALRVVIDDGGDVATADVVVNGTGLAIRHGYPKLRPGALRLCGTAWTLVRAAFSKARPTSPRSGFVIAVGSGERAAQWLHDLLATPLSLHEPGCVVVGASFPDRAALVENASRQGLNVHAGLSAEALAALLAGAAVTLSTGGMIVPEVLVSGAAGIAFPNEPDLVEELSWLAGQRALLALPADGHPQAARDALRTLQGDEPRRSAQVRAAGEVFDGRGAARVAHAILGELRVRSEAR